MNRSESIFRPGCSRLAHALGALALLLLPAAAGAPISIRLSSQFLVRGEQAVLEYVLPEGVSSEARLEVPEVDGLDIRAASRGAEPRRGFGRRREFVFPFSVSSYEPGTYTIPPARIEDGGGAVESEPITLRVFHETDLEWSEVEVGGETMRYAAAFHVSKTDPFVKEVVPVELKVYIPARQRVEDWGIPDFERDGVAAWRFEPRPSIGRANLRGRSHYAVSYPSTLSPNREGDVAVGPAELRLITVQTSVRNFGQAFYQPVNLEIPALELESRPLPPGAPEGFDDAVGRFRLDVNAPETDVREGDPVAVNLTVSGRGNFDALTPPQPLNPEGWKIYPPSRSDGSREERREIRGAVNFRQFMRPLEPQSQIPPFRLVYFDPDEAAYQTVYSEAIPIDLTPSTSASALGAAPPPAQSVPVEEMTDILGPREAAALVTGSGARLPKGWWQIIPFALALALLARVAARYLAPKFRRDPEKDARRRDLDSLRAAPDDAPGFYRRAGQVVETWLGQSDDPLPRDILAKRDQTCFHGEGESARLDREERRRVLRGLRRLVLPALVLLALGLGTTRAGEPPPAPEDAAENETAAPGDLYEQGRYREAAAGWLDAGDYEHLSADHLYNIGNAAYRLGQPGEAALYWRRALHRDATHPEARQNLRFFERKFGSITYQYKDYQHAIAAIPLDTWSGLARAGGWLVALGLLVFPATRPGARLRVGAIAALVTAPLLIGAGAAGWYYYPDDVRFAPAAQQAVVTSDRAIVRTDAARNAPEVIEAPAGSLCRILERSGDWIYVGFTNKTRGWLPAGEITPLVPRTPPDPPATRGSAADPAKTT